MKKGTVPNERSIGLFRIVGFVVLNENAAYEGEWS
jgi:hypothetical protein